MFGSWPWSCGKYEIRVRIFTKLYGRGVLCINICIVSEAIQVKLDVSNTGQGRRFYVQIVKIDPTFQVPCLEGLDSVLQQTEEAKSGSSFRILDR